MDKKINKNTRKVEKMNQAFIKGGEKDLTIVAKYPKGRKDFRKYSHEEIEEYKKHQKDISRENKAFSEDQILKIKDSLSKKTKTKDSPIDVLKKTVKTFDNFIERTKHDPIISQIEKGTVFYSKKNREFYKITEGSFNTPNKKSEIRFEVFDKNMIKSAKAVASLKSLEEDIRSGDLVIGKNFQEQKFEKQNKINQKETLNQKISLINKEIEKKKKEEELKKSISKKINTK